MHSSVKPLSKKHCFVAYMLLIGLAGAKRVGKDVVASMLVDRHGYTQYALASPLKALCQDLFGLSDQQVHGRLKEVLDTRYHLTPRQILQIVGTDCIRSISPTHWLDAFEATHVGADVGQKVVVSDVRFQNEVDTIKRLGGHVFLITRECCETCDRHVSEQQVHTLRGVDGTIRNTGTLQELKDQAERAIGLVHI